jgi:hypothetical protein
MQRHATKCNMFHKFSGTRKTKPPATAAEGRRRASTAGNNPLDTAMEGGYV